MRKIQFASLAAVLVLACSAIVAGCAGTKAAYQEAQSLDEYAYVITEHYASLVKQAADLKESATTPPAAVAAMQRADDAAHLIVVGDPDGSPPTPGLSELAALYQQARDATTEAELQQAVNTAILRMADLLRAIKTARGGT